MTPPRRRGRRAGKAAKMWIWKEDGKLHFDKIVFGKMEHQFTKRRGERYGYVRIEIRELPSSRRARERRARTTTWTSRFAKGSPRPRKG
jgi:hypothetical protein